MRSLGPPLEPDPKAFYGRAGWIIEQLRSHTEADPMALLVDLITSFGAAVGPGPYIRIDGANHYPRVYTVVVGATSRSRKGTSRGVIREVMRAADRRFGADCEISGLSTGEGLIEALAKREDRRLFVHEPEFSRVLRVSARDANTLADVLRDLWDRTSASVLTRGNPLRIEGKLVSILAHITVEELRERLTSLEVANGFGNRFLFVWATRRRKLAMGNSLSVELIEECGRQLRTVLLRARTRTEITWAMDAEEPWTKFYESLPDDVTGVVGGLTARAEAHVLRLALLFALLDGEEQIRAAHVEAAIAVWDYCERSIKRIFGGRTGLKVRDRVIATLENSASGGASKTDLYRGLGNDVRRDELTGALNGLMVEGLVQISQRPSGGRPVEWVSLREAIPSVPKEPKKASEMRRGHPPTQRRRIVRFFGRLRRKRSQT